MHDRTAAFAARSPLWTAMLLSLGAAISNGLSRFSYGLLLPMMRADLGWSYLMAGAMNTSNAVGYLLGALTTPALLRRLAPWPVLVMGALSTGLVIMALGFVTTPALLLALRLVSGVTGAWLFVSGGVLSARLSQLHPQHAGLIIGSFFGGTGLGIAVSSVLVPAICGAAAALGEPHSWQWAWIALGGVCLAATPALSLPSRRIEAAVMAQSTQRAVPATVGPQVPALRPLLNALGGYFMFGVGYIGYMTFVIALLREQGMSAPRITAFYGMLGLVTIVSSRLWAGVLDKFKGGEAMAILSASLGVATLLPVLSAAPTVAFLSGLVFGAVFQSLAASSTALVRHNLPPSAWPAGISAFTTVFAVGQVLGPTVVGWISDSAGGLQRGLIFSALALFAGALLASRQRPLPHAFTQPAAA